MTGVSVFSAVHVTVCVALTRHDVSCPYSCRAADAAASISGHGMPLHVFSQPFAHKTEKPSGFKSG
jgi:hypothetical protein